VDPNEREADLAGYAEIEKHIRIKGADDLAALLKEHLP